MPGGWLNQLHPPLISHRRHCPFSKRALTPPRGPALIIPHCGGLLSCLRPENVLGAEAPDLMKPGRQPEPWL